MEENRCNDSFYFLLETDKHKKKEENPWRECFDKEWLEDVNWEDLKENIDGVTYNLRLGEEAYLSTEKEIIDLKRKGCVIIDPGETAILMSYEKLDLPLSYLALFSLKYTHGGEGLVNISGFQANPGWKGKYSFSVYNAGPKPVIIRYKEEIYHMYIIQLRKKVWDKNKCKIPLEERRQKMSFFNQERIPSKYMERIKGPPVSLHRLDRRVDKLETNMKILVSLLIGGFATIIANIFLGLA